jgi:hypothetical protein
MPNALAKLRSWIKPWIRPWETGADPMEIRRAVLEDIDSRAVAAGQGRRLFPFDRVRVEILAADAEERAVLEAVVDDWDLPRAVAERLREREVRVPEGLTVETTVVEGPIPEPGERRWKVVYEKTGRAAEAPASPTAARPAVELTVLKGRAKQRVYTLDTERIWIGRLEESSRARRAPPSPGSTPASPGTPATAAGACATSRAPPAPGSSGKAAASRSAATTARACGSNLATRSTSARPA